MHQLLVTQKEIIIIDSALSLLRMAVANIEDEWATEDLETLVILSKEIKRLRQADQRKRDQEKCRE